MIKYALGSTSMLKIRATRAALEVYPLDLHGGSYETIPCEVDSTVAKQPYGWQEISVGAINRASAALGMQKADFGIGIESGLVQLKGRWYDVPAVVIVSKKDVVGEAFGAAFPIPQHIVDLCNDRHFELGPLVRKLSGSDENDPLHFYTGGRLKREEQIKMAIVSALAPVLEKKRFAMMV